MGRQSEAMVHFQGRSGQAKLLLEGTEVLCRGEIRAKMPRCDIHGWAIDGDDLVLTTAQGPLRATIGLKDAEGWLRALAKPLPDLAEKLGLTQGRKAFVYGDLRDAALSAAVAPYRAHPASLAAVCIAELYRAQDLDGALGALGDLPLWGVTIKGNASPFSDGDLRRTMRSLGYVDTKSCAVSLEMTATRWQKRAK